MILDLASNAAGAWSLAAPLAQLDIPMSFGSNLVLASAVVGFLIPILIAAINRRTWSSEAKGASAFVVCALAAALLVYVMDLFNAEDWLRSALIVFVMAITTYNFYWKPSTIAPAIEKATG